MSGTRTRARARVRHRSTDQPGRSLHLVLWHPNPVFPRKIHPQGAARPGNLPRLKAGIRDLRGRLERIAQNLGQYQIDQIDRHVQNFRAPKAMHLQGNDQGLLAPAEACPWRSRALDSSRDP